MSRASASYSHSHSNGSHATRESFDVSLRVAIIETHRAHSSRTPSTETHSVDSHECHRHQRINAQNLCSCILNTLPVVLDFRQSTTFAVSHSPQDLWLAHLCHATRQTDSEEPSHHSRAASPPNRHPLRAMVVAHRCALWRSVAAVTRSRPPSSACAEHACASQHARSPFLVSPQVPSPQRMRTRQVSPSAFALLVMPC